MLSRWHSVSVHCQRVRFCWLTSSTLGCVMVHDVGQDALHLGCVCQTLGLLACAAFQALRSRCPHAARPKVRALPNFLAHSPSRFLAVFLYSTLVETNVYFECLLGSRVCMSRRVCAWVYWRTRRAIRSFGGTCSTPSPPCTGSPKAASSTPLGRRWEDGTPPPHT